MNNPFEQPLSDAAEAAEFQSGLVDVMAETSNVGSYELAAAILTAVGKTAEQFGGAEYRDQVFGHIKDGVHIDPADLTNMQTRWPDSAQFLHDSLVGEVNAANQRVQDAQAKAQHKHFFARLLGAA